MISKLQSGGDVRTDWRAINALIDEKVALATRLAVLENPAGRRQIYGGGRPTPFAIYQTGTLKYKVRAGLVIITDAPAIVPTGLETELTSPGGADYWIVCDLTTTTAVVSGTASSPVFSTEKIPIGWIDSDGAIHQFLHDNIFSPCVTTEADP